MNFIDIFAGAGGLSEGFVRQGFMPIAHVEMNKDAALTLKTRMIYHELKNSSRLDIYNNYISGNITREDLYSINPNIDNFVIQNEISDESIDSIFNRIDKNLEDLKQKNVDILIGGPPCQAYSLVGRARDPYSKEHDPRNYLYKQYIKFLIKYEPKMFIFENVPGILTAGKGQLFSDVKKYMDEAGYDIEARTLNASDFGVLQKRLRVILIGWKKGTRYSYPTLGSKLHNFQVKDLLIDLPKLQPGQSIINGEYTSNPTDYLQLFNLRDRKDKLTQHITRPHNERDREIYEHVILTWENENRRLKYNELPERLKTHKNRESFLDRFKVVGSNQSYSHTMVAHIAKDGHYYIHPDISQLRSISVREAARIQSFPDNYFFEGSRTAVFTQIGNAVPPLMSETLASKIMEMISSS
ncbi:DNA cytosine methyltransferase [Brevibacillus laterosporus]|uniref:Cytosine-specific methyltransferase n=1 Tax=Brevibacillus laterosporus TaxID=1465 RepID=A0A0F6XZB1_BRELA|nr:cytosine methyltransferase [Brevibacillus laterosporus]